MGAGRRWYNVRIKERTMTYEEYLDEVTTLIVEKYDLSDEAAIKLVVDAQAKGYFVAHDDKKAMRTLDRAHEDARALFKAGSTK